MKFQCTSKLVLPSLIVWTLSAYTLAENTKASEKMQFDTDVQTVFDQRCVVCHRIDDPLGGLILERSYSYMQIVNVRSIGADMLRIKPNDPDASYLLHKMMSSHIVAGGRGSPMPPHPPWTTTTDDEIQVIRLWIQQGAKNSEEE